MTGNPYLTTASYDYLEDEEYRMRSIKMFDITDNVVWFILAVMIFFAAMFLFTQLGSRKPKVDDKENVWDLVRRIGPLAYQNTIGDVTAICTRNSFQDGFDYYKGQVKIKRRKPWEKVIVRARPTFTFFNGSGAHRAVHTGTEEDATKLIEAIVKKATGCTAEELGPIYNTISKGLVEEDRRLFVPYSSGTDAELEKQYEEFGDTTLKEAEEALVVNW